ncbi:MAG TPA: FAD-dependent oxidoreductase [Methylomirabilota bacterium]|nr:FAD-dependent oxidoreductase [Methylomirabilota bacterium]
MKRLVIIGGGVIGLSSAYYAAERGFEVTVLDRNPAERDGCSFGNAGMIVPSHFVPLAAPGAVALGLKWMFNPESPFWIKPRLDTELFDWSLKFWQASNSAHVSRAAPLLRDLHMASRAAFEALAAITGNGFELVQRGLLMLCKNAHTLEEEAAMAGKARELGVPADVLDSAAAAKLDLGIKMDIAGAVHFPKDCHLTPGKFMASLQALCAKSGVRFVHSAEVTSIERSGDRINAIKSNQGEFDADEFLLAGGSWSAELAKSVGLKIPMQAGKGYSLTLEKPPEKPAICAILTEARVAVTPMGSKLRIGGTMEIAGLNEDVNPVRVQGIIKSVPRYYPNFRDEHFAGVKPWRGLRPCSPDGLPYVGRTRRFNNLTIATGHAMMGLSLGPVTGKLVSETLSGGKPSIDLTLLNPDRYA